MDLPTPIQETLSLSGLATFREEETVIDKQAVLPKIGAFIWLAATRSWLAFCLMSFLFALVFLLIDGDNPLRSDDPYVVGFFFGCIGACLALLYSMVELIKKGGWFKDAVYFVCCGLWTVFLLLAGRNAIEGRWLINYIMLGSLIAAAVEWPLLRFRAPRVLYAIASIACAVLIGLYMFVAARMYS